MRRLHLLLLAVFAVSAFGAVLVASASAEETLLAEWLVGTGSMITENLESETNTTLLFEDTKTLIGAQAFECRMTLFGAVGPDGEDAVTAVLNAAGKASGEPLVVGSGLIGNGAASGVGSECKTETACAAGTSASPIEFWPLGLPWSTLLFLMEPSKEILNLIYSLGAAGTEIGYELLCLIASINTVDECKALDLEILVQNNATTGDAETPSGTTLMPNIICSQSGGEATGVDETVGASLITLVNKELLSVSSE
jgi:hypothetical protein